MDKSKLLALAEEAARKAYSPYSNFCVGAALYTKSGKIYTGTNIENGSFSLTCCAERVAFFKAVSDGEKEFSDIAIVGSKDDDFSKSCPPCGACRQVMSEFCSGDFRIHLSDKTYTLNSLLPESFEGVKGEKL